MTHPRCFGSVLLGLLLASGWSCDRSTNSVQPSSTPDLVITSSLTVSLAGTGVPGGSLGLGPWTMRNQGTATARGPFLNGYYLSSDATVTAADRRLLGAADTDYGELAAGTSFTYPGDPQVAIPADVTPGRYFFGILLDIGNAVAESDESNNFKAIEIAIVADPG